MAAAQNLRAVGDQIEQLLDELQATADPRSYDRATELLRLVSELYGAGLARVVELAEDRDRGFVDALVGDDLVASLLLVHGLHPETLSRRVEDALTKVRPLLASHGGDVELLGIDADAGVVRLRLLGSCDGCPSSSLTLQMAVERGITEAAPEIVRIEVEEPSRASGLGSPVSFGAKPVNGGPVNGGPVNGGPVNGVPVTARPVYTECPSEMAAT
jgi:Fe-S cluster biogenesis protein NfuA